MVPWLVHEWIPRLALGYSQTDTPLAAYAPLGGVYAITLCASMSAGAFVILVRGTTHERLAAAALVALIWIPASLLSNRSWTQPEGAPMTVAIVQGAVPQEVKWNREYRDSTVQLYYRLTVDHFGKDMIVWPEAALPIVAHEAEQFLRGLSAQAATKGSRIVTGLLRREPGRDAYYNGLLVLDGQPQWYYKRRLVPFGEFFPVPPFIRRRMRLMNLPTTNLTAGQREQPALTMKGREAGSHDLL